ncbi:calcium-transporting ATPase 12, plasma membrane-type-like [Andrographis paniculata]|uniref:calcium-transporting ATPase 12, plasma membrane-type-like n=1 Tax=Andrographis paniculata TaxID=175694 RepID=UPI0021E89AA2|nr:calcium-transporting ATPase 12, plasma membrane-type-like [Andrographis paniculata]
MECLRSNSVIKRLQSFMVVEVPAPESTTHFPVDAAKLTHLLKTKDPATMAELGGIQGIVSALNSDTKLGIRGDASDLGRRRNAFGSNAGGISGIRSYLWPILCAGKVFLDLKAATACALYLVIVGILLQDPKSGWEEGAVPLISFYACYVIKEWIEHGIEILFMEVREVGDMVLVIRNGLKQQIPSSEIVTGDVVFVKNGDKIPGDGLFLEEIGDPPLKFDESHLKETAFEVEVDSSNPYLYSGSITIRGQGKILITGVGKSTVCFIKHGPKNFNRRLIKSLDLQGQVDVLAWFLRKVNRILGVACVLISLARYFSGHYKDDDGRSWFVPGKTKAIQASYDVVYMCLNTLLLLAAMDTNNFPWAMKVSLCQAVCDFSRRDVVIRNLLAWEKIGLGVAKVNVVERGGNTFVVQRVEASEFLNVPQFIEGVETTVLMLPNIADLVRQGIYLNTTAIAYHSTKAGKHRFSGSPFEQAILSEISLELDVNWKRLNESCSVQKIDSSEVKGRRILVQLDEDPLLHVHRRGPAGVILEMCSSFYDDSGTLSCLNEEVKKSIEAKLQSIINDGDHAIAIAHRVVSKQEWLNDRDLIKNEDRYNLLGFVALKEMKEAIKSIVTADNSSSAVWDAKFYLVEHLVEDEALCPATSSPVIIELMKEVAGIRLINSHCENLVACDEYFSKSLIGTTIIAWAVQELNLDNELSIYRSQNVDLEDDGGLGFLMSLENDTMYVHEKGFAEHILSNCSSYYRTTGEKQVFSETERMLLMQKAQVWESRKLPWIAFVHYDNDDDDDDYLWSLLGILIFDQISIENNDVDDAISKVGSEASIEASVGIEDGEISDTRSSDILIMDGDSSSLDLISGWSSCIRHNSQLFLQFQITTTITSMMNTYIGSFSSNDDSWLVVLLIQLVWVNFGMGFIAAEVFGRQKPRLDAKLGHRLLMNAAILRNILGQVAYQSVVVTVLGYCSAKILGKNGIGGTVTAAMPVILQVFNMVNARKIEEKNVFSGMRRRMAVLVAAMVAVPMVLVEAVHAINKSSAGLSAVDWGICVVFGFGTWVVAFAVKFVPIEWLGKIVEE